MPRKPQHESRFFHIKKPKTVRDLIELEGELIQALLHNEISERQATAAKSLIKEYKADLKEMGPDADQIDGLSDDDLVAAFIQSFLEFERPHLLPRVIRELQRVVRHEQVSAQDS